MIKIKYIFPIISILIGIVMAFSIAEATLRLLKSGYGNAPLAADPILHHVHPHSYYYKVYSDHGEYGGHHVYYDKEGFVASPEIVDKTETRQKYNLAILGDSFVEAGQVAYENSFVGILEKAGTNQTMIRNYGVSSYSPAYYLLQWRQYVCRFHPTHVFILLYSNDIEGDRVAVSLARRDSKGEIIAIPAEESTMLQEVLRKSYVIRLVRYAQIKATWIIKNWNRKKDVVGGFVEDNPDLSELTQNLLNKLSQEIADSGAKVILMAVPSKFRLITKEKVSGIEFGEKVGIWAQKNDIAYIDLIGPFKKAGAGEKLFFERDIHFNEAGHRVVAKTIAVAYPELFPAFPAEQ